MTSIKSRLRKGETLIGSLITIASTDVAEIMSRVGFDYLWMDVEHSAMDFADAQRLIQSVGGRVPCLVRVPENKDVWIKKALDTGCDGIVIPQVNTAAEARAAIERCLYPPNGKRSIGVARAHQYGMALEEYIGTINDKLAIILQVEHKVGVRNIESILQVPGISAIFIGPFDLSGSLNLLGQINHPDVQRAIEEVRRACVAAKMPAGIFATDATFARNAIAKGFRLIAQSMDAVFLWKSAQQALRDTREVK